MLLIALGGFGFGFDFDLATCFSALLALLGGRGSVFARCSLGGVLGGDSWAILCCDDV
jgi:hypothetical protein